MFESWICGQLGSPPTPLFTQSVRRHTRACLDWVFASETRQVFQPCVLALPLWRHQEAQSVTRPHGASLLSAYPPFTSSPFLAQHPQQPWQLGSEAAAEWTSPSEGGLSEARAGVCGVWKERERLGWRPGDRSFSGRVWIPRGPVMKLAMCGLGPGLGR